MTSYTKMQIAEHQLHLAIRLYFAEQDYISAITLAGAAEEILGKLVSEQGKKPVIEGLAELAVAINKTEGEETTVRDIISFANLARNGLKHLDKHTPHDKRDVIVESGDAEDMLDRAVGNYQMLNEVYGGPVVEYLNSQRMRRKKESEYAERRLAEIKANQ